LSARASTFALNRLVSRLPQNRIANGRRPASLTPRARRRSRPRRPRLRLVGFHGPTGGYLTSLALDIACSDDGHHPHRGPVAATLHVVRLAAAGPLTAPTVDGSQPAGTRIAVANVLFTQEEPFANRERLLQSASRGQHRRRRDPSKPSCRPRHTRGDGHRPASSADNEPVLLPADRGARERPKTVWDLVWVRAHTARCQLGRDSAQYDYSTPGIQRITCDSSREYMAGGDAAGPTHQPSTSSPHQCCSRPARGAYRTDKSHARRQPPSIPSPTVPPP